MGDPPIDMPCFIYIHMYIYMHIMVIDGDSLSNNCNEMMIPQNLSIGTGDRTNNLMVTMVTMVTSNHGGDVTSITTV